MDLGGYSEGERERKKKKREGLGRGGKKERKTDRQTERRV